jgi:hypothetical protein
MDISIRYNIPANSDAVEVMHHISHINNTLSDPSQGKQAGREVISRIITDLDTQGIMYTDSNGLHTLKRVRNHRDTWTLNSSEPISDNYYPVNARAYTVPPYKHLHTESALTVTLLQVPPRILRHVSRHRHRPLASAQNVPISSRPTHPLTREAPRSSTARLSSWCSVQS